MRKDLGDFLEIDWLSRYINKERRVLNIIINMFDLKIYRSLGLIENWDFC